MSKSLNNAFLRAYSKGNANAPQGAVPGPHVRGFGSSQHDAPADTRPPAAHNATPATNRSEVQPAQQMHEHVHERPQESKPVADPAAERTQHVPAPHIPLVPVTAPADVLETSLTTHQTLIVGDLAAAYLLDTQSLLVSSPALPLVDSPHVDAEPIGSAAPAAHVIQPADAPAHGLAEADIWPTPPVRPDTKNDPLLNHIQPHVSSEQFSQFRSNVSHQVPPDEQRESRQPREQREAEQPETDQLQQAANVADAVRESAARPIAGASPSPSDEALATEDAAAHTATPLAAAWEVDRLGWSDTCQELYASEHRYFEQAGRQLLSATAEGLNVLAVTSAYRGEGRTTLALLLARCAADAGIRVAVLDADLDNPQLAASVKVQPASDWRSVLTDGIPLAETAVHAVEERITLFPLDGDAAPSSLDGKPALRLADPHVTSLIQTIATRFPLLIIDMGPLAADDRRLFASGQRCPINAAIVVRDLRSTGDQQTRDLVQKLMQLGVEAVGVAENFVRRAA